MRHALNNITNEFNATDMSSKTYLQLVVDDELRNQLRETKHVHEGCQGWYDEAVPSPMTLVHKRVDSVSQKTRDSNVRDVSERQSIIPAIDVRKGKKQLHSQRTLGSSSHRHSGRACLQQRLAKYSDVIHKSRTSELHPVWNDGCRCRYENSVHSFSNLKAQSVWCSRLWWASYLPSLN